MRKYSKFSGSLGFLVGALFFAPAFAQTEADKVDCSHLTAEQMGDKDACWNVKKAELRRGTKDSEAYVEIVNDLSPGNSIVNVAQPPLSDDTNRNIYEIPWFKNAVSLPGSSLPAGNSGDAKSGNQ